MKKRNRLRLFTAALAIFLTLLGLWADSRRMLTSASMSLEYTYRRALNDLTDHVSGIQSTLQKTPYVNTSVMQNAVSAKLLEQSGGAKASMAALPFSQEKTEKLSRFLSQTGDYALSLSRRSAAGQDKDENDLKTLAVLEEYAGKLSAALQKLQAQLDTEDLSLLKLTDAWENVEDLSDLPSIGDAFDEAAKSLSQFPALLYDGPFSDHIQRREPLSLQNEKEIGRTKAAEKAAEFLSCQESELVFTGEGGGNLPVFSFSRGDSHVNVTKAGGKIAYFKKSGAVSAASLTGEEAVEKAKKLLEAMDLGPVRESYYIVSDNLCTVNFSALLGTGSDSAAEIICYPDLVKATLELEQGGMVEYDAAGYLMNHRERQIGEPPLPREKAEQSLSPLLTVQKAALALVPTPGLDEVLCWEFQCVANDGSGREFLAYINCETGQEEQLYLLQKDDHGVLVF